MRVTDGRELAVPTRRTGEPRRRERSGHDRRTAGVPGVMTFGTAAAGEVLAERYRLEEHVDTDAAGRQIWRGIDTVLRGRSRS